MMTAIVTLQDALAAGTVLDRCSIPGLCGYQMVARAVLADEGLAERLAVLMSEWSAAAAGADDLEEVIRSVRPWGMGDLAGGALKGGPGRGLLAEREKALEHWQWLRAIASDPAVASGVLAVEDTRHGLP